MPIGYFTLSGTYLAYGDTPASGTVRIDGIPQVIVDSVGDKIKVGPKTVTLDSTGSFTIQLPTDSTSGDSTSLGYRVTARLKHANVDPVEFYAKAANATLKMSAVTPQQVEPVSVSGANAAAAAASATAAATSATAAQAAATAAQAVPTTTDTLIAGRVNDSTSATRAALSSTYARAGDPAFQALRNALDGGRSAAIWGVGDSTIDASTGIKRPMEYLADRVAAKYPNVRVITYTRDGTTDKWNAPTVVQAGASGRRYAQFGARSSRYRPPVHADSLLTTGNLDIRALINPTSWAPAAPQAVVARMAKSVSGVVSSDLAWFFGLDGVSGKLRMRISSNGTDLNFDQSTSSVAVTPPTGGDGFMWVRVTVVITGTGRSITYYTSPADDGFTWTQLGTVDTDVSTAALYTPATGSFFEIGATGWQPAASAYAGKIAEVQVRDGVDGRTLTPNLPELWQRYPDSSTTYGGSQEFRVLNAGRSGSAMAYHTDPVRLPRETPDYGQSVLIFCDSHNEVGASGQLEWLTPYQAWVDAVTARTPNAAVVVVKQNPETSTYANFATQTPLHVIRLDELARLAAKNRWSVLDLYSAFNSAPGGLASVMDADGLHPKNPEGWTLAGNELIRMAGLTA